jgi:hypothetical protein
MLITYPELINTTLELLFTIKQIISSHPTRVAVKAAPHAEPTN